VQFLAEIGNVHVDGAGFHAFGAQAPDAHQNLIPGDGSPGMGSQITQELDFPLGEFAALAVVAADARCSGSKSGCRSVM
jgi:hypothetical protein